MSHHDAETGCSCSDYTTYGSINVELPVLLLLTATLDDVKQSNFCVRELLTHQMSPCGALNLVATLSNQSRGG